MENNSSTCNSITVVNYFNASRMKGTKPSRVFGDLQPLRSSDIRSVCVWGEGLEIREKTNVFEHSRDPLILFPPRPNVISTQKYSTQNLKTSRYGALGDRPKTSQVRYGVEKRMFPRRGKNGCLRYLSSINP